MLRFLFNFAAFGVAFYLLHLYLPDTFNMLVSWADQVVAFGHDVYDKIVSQFSSKS